MSVYGNDAFTGIRKSGVAFDKVTAKRLIVKGSVNVSEGLVVGGNVQVNGRVGFYGTTPVAQPAAVTNALTAGSATAADVAGKFNSLLTNLRSLGLIDT